MNVISAIRFLMATEGWNFYGAEDIVNTIIDEGLSLTEEELKKISDDYKDR